MVVAWIVVPVVVRTTCLSSIALIIGRRVLLWSSAIFWARCIARGWSHRRWETPILDITTTATYIVIFCSIWRLARAVCCWMRVAITRYTITFSAILVWLTAKVRRSWLTLTVLFVVKLVWGSILSSRAVRIRVTAGIIGTGVGESIWHFLLAWFLAWIWSTINIYIKADFEYRVLWIKQYLNQN